MKKTKKKLKKVKKWILPKQKLKYKNNKTFYQKSAGLRLLQGWPNLTKKIFFLHWTKNDNLWVLLYKYVKRGQKRLKKAKKMDIAQTKTDIYKQQSLLSKIRWVTFFTSVIQFKKKKKKFDFGQKWEILSSFAKKPQI